MKFLIGFFIGITFSMCTEVPVLYLLYNRFYKKITDEPASNLKIGLSGILATALSYPFLQSIFLTICSIFIEDRALSKLVFYSVGEIMVVLIETLIYKGVLGLPWREAFVFSFICNLISFILGLILFEMIVF